MDHDTWKGLEEWYTASEETFLRKREAIELAKRGYHTWEIKIPYERLLAFFWIACNKINPYDAELSYRLIRQSYKRAKEGSKFRASRSGFLGEEHLHRHNDLDDEMLMEAKEKAAIAFKKKKEAQEQGRMWWRDDDPAQD